MGGSLKGTSVKKGPHYLTPSSKLIDVLVEKLGDRVHDVLFLLKA
jgi:hypothetical protein